jgi:hypothetical protein
MKKLILFASILLIAVACKKTEKEPIGPTDIRINNITTVNMNNVTVNTFDSTFNFGLVKADSISAYHRFDRAYPKANISAIINGQKYKTDTTNFAYQQYLGQMKVTYKIYIISDALKSLGMSWIPESPLK